MDKSLRVMIIITGVRSSQILGPGEGSVSAEAQDMSEELGIEFLD